ncbi:MAG: hypothetical protein ACE5JL_13430, partial [Dehalococcoidia bacterium]
MVVSQLVPLTGRSQDLSPVPLPFAPLVALLTPFRVLSNLLTGKPTMDELRGEVRARTRIMGRKFNKVEAAYTAVPPLPPIGWRYECGRCTFYQPETKTCEVVGLPGDPLGGEAIHPLSWCAWW